MVAGRSLARHAKGGIRVKVVDEKPWLGREEHAARRGNEERWVPYWHVIPPR